MSLEFIKFHNTEFEVEFEYYRERDGLRETGTNLLLTPPEPEFVDIISVRVGGSDILSFLSPETIAKLEEKILNLAHSRER